MARLRLKPGKSYGAVGHVLVAMAKEAYHASAAGQSRPGNAYAYEPAFQDLFLDTFVDVPEDLKVTTEPSVVEDGTFVMFHFDRTVKRDGKEMRIVNIAVPDFQGKVTRRAESGEIMTAEPDPTKFDLTDVAAEAFGFVVILGCVG